MTNSSYSEFTNGATSLTSYPVMAENSTFTGYTTTNTKEASYFVIPVSYADAVNFTFSGTNVEQLYVEYRFVTSDYLSAYGAYGGDNIADIGNGYQAENVASESIGSLSAASSGGFQTSSGSYVTSGSGYLIIEVYGGSDITSDALTQDFQLVMTSGSPPPSNPDLVFTNFTLTPSSEEANGSVTINYSLNEGSGTADASQVQVYLRPARTSVRPPPRR